MNYGEYRMKLLRCMVANGWPTWGEIQREAFLFLGSIAAFVGAVIFPLTLMLWLGYHIDDAALWVVSGLVWFVEFSFYIVGAAAERRCLIEETFNDED